MSADQRLRVRPSCWKSDVHWATDRARRERFDTAQWKKREGGREKSYLSNGVETARKLQNTQNYHTSELPSLWDGEFPPMPSVLRFISAKYLHLHSLY